MGPTSTKSLDQAPSSREAILRKLRERIVSFAASRMQRDAAEDLAQEVLILLHEKYGNLDRLEDLLPLSLQIVRFKLLAHRRKARRHGEFTQVAGVNGIVLTKLDGTAKGGVAVAIANDLKLPIRYVGVGEGIDDLVTFSVDEYVDGLFEDKW